MDTGATEQNIEQAYRKARQMFIEAGMETPDMDAALLLEHASGATTLSRMMQPDQQLTDGQSRSFANYIARRIAREPVHRIIGSREFYGLKLFLNEATLVPRPDTETLVDMVMPFVHEKIEKTGQCSVLDLGTGTGAIALAILSEAPRAVATATDIAPRALAQAEENAVLHGVKNRFTAIHSNWFENIHGRFDLIVSNPPYIASRVIDGLTIDVREHDPAIALDGGLHGLDAYSLIASGAADFLQPGGRIGIEIGFDQKNTVSALFKDAGFKAIDARMDLNGHDRTIFFT